KSEIPHDNLVGKKGIVLTNHYSGVDTGRASKIANRLKKAFESKVRHVSTNEPQKKISARLFALERPAYRRKELSGRGKKDIFFVLDCSGSMAGYHIQEA